MRFILLPIYMMLLAGCSTIRDVDVARKDIAHAEAVVENDIEPRLIELKDVIIAVETDFRKERKKALLLWEQGIEPRIKQLEAVAGNIESDLNNDIKDIAQLWKVNIEPRIARLEKLIAGIESKVEGKLHKALVDWHKNVENHLLHLENLPQASKIEIKSAAKNYQALKVDLRSIKVRLVNDDQKKHVDNLITHIENFGKSSVSADNITQMRNVVEGELAALFRKI